MMTSAGTEPDTPPELPFAWRTAAVIGLFFFCIMAATGWLELYLLEASLPLFTDAPRLLAAAFLTGFVPAATLGWLATRLEGRIRLPWVQRILFWLATAAGLLIAIGTTLADPGASLSTLHLALGAAALVVFIAIQKTDAIAAKLPYWLFGVGLAWLVAGVALSQMLHNLHGDLPSIAHASPSVIGLLCPLLFVAHAKLTNLWRTRSQGRFRLVFVLAFGVCTLVSLVVIWQLQTRFIGMYLPVKAFVSASAAIALWLIFEPVLTCGARRFEPLGWLGVAVAIGGIAASIWMVTQPIGERFGSYPVRSLVGLSAQALSAPDDADKDGFYAADVGGNDCDDNDPQATPIAHDPAKHCWAGTEKPPEPATRPPGEDLSDVSAEHVVLVVVDALRADLLSDADNAAWVPHLRSLAERSLTFERAYPPGNATLLSVLPTLAGASPIAALESIARGEPEPPEKLLAQESVLSGGGESLCTAMLSYSTLAKGWLLELAGEGLDVAREMPERTDSGHTAPFVADGVREALETCRGRPSMLAIYIDDPHRDYQKQGYSCRDGSAGGRECYLEEVSMVDEMIGQLVALYQARQMLDRTLFVVTSDHGEAFGEHGHTQHATSVYEEQIHVPLVVYAPGAKPQTIRQPVSLLGFKATVAHATGNELEEAAIYPSWLAIAEAPTLAPPPVIHNWMGRYKRGWTSPSSAIVVGDEKLIYDWRTSRVRLFDLASDPDEFVDLAGRKPERTQALLQRFRWEHLRLQTAGRQ